MQLVLIFFFFENIFMDCYSAQRAETFLTHSSAEVGFHSLKYEKDLSTETLDTAMTAFIVSSFRASGTHVSKL